MTDPRERLRDLARSNGSSLSGLSRLIGRNPTYLQQFVTKGSPRRLEERDRRTLAEFFGVAESELGGEIAGQQENSHRPDAAGVSARWVRVPRLPLAASAGPGAIAQDAEPRDVLMFSDRWLRQQGLARAELSAIAVEGDSMQPLLVAGDEVLVDHTPRPFRDGVHVVRLDDSLLIKRVAAQGGGRMLLLSENAAYPPIDVAAGDIEVIGRVVWKGGRI